MNLTTSGATVAYFDSGGDGRPVILSHGFLMDHSMFDAQVTALTPEFRVITWDERGFGETTAEGPFTYWDSAADALAILDHLGVDRAIVGGMSQGGFISLRLALMAPERVEALVIIDSQSGVEDPAVIPAYDAMRDVWLESGPGPVQDAVASMILGPGDWPEWFSKWEALDREQFLHAYDCLVRRDDLTDRIGEITVPALIVHGSDDASIPVAKAELLRDGLGGAAELVVVEGAPHAANITHPDAVNAAMLRFLRAL